MLALFDCERLDTVQPTSLLTAYAGDLAALSSGEVLSCPRADAVDVDPAVART